MKNRPLVSVIVPNYNHAKFIEERIESIVRQTYRNFELIVLDDGSDDQSPKLIEEFSKSLNFNFIRNVTNQGSPFKQWLHGLSYANGEFIWIAESDDVSDCEFLERCVTAHEFVNTGMCYTLSHEINDESMRIGFAVDTPTMTSLQRITDVIYTLSDGLSFVRLNLVYGNKIPNVSAVLFRRASLEKFLNMIEDFRYIGDWFLYIHLIASEGVCLVNERLNFFRKHDNTTRQKRKSKSDWGIINLEYVRLYQGLLNIGAIREYRYRSLLTKMSEGIALRADLDHAFSQSIDLFQDVEARRIIVWGAGVVGSLVIECLISSAWHDRRLIVVDKKIRSVKVLGKTLMVHPSDSIVTLIHPGDLIIFATLQFDGQMKAKLDHLGLKNPTLSLKDLLTSPSKVQILHNGDRMARSL